MKGAMEYYLLGNSQGNVKTESHFERETRLGSGRGGGGAGRGEAFSPVQRLGHRPTACCWGLPGCCGHLVCTCPGLSRGLLLRCPRLGGMGVPKVGRGILFTLT